MSPDPFRRALVKLTRRAASDPQFASALGASPWDAVRQYGCSLHLTEDEARQLRQEAPDLWGPRVLACTPQARSAIRGPYGEPVRALVAGIRKDAGLRRELAVRPAGVLRSPHRFGLTLEDVAALRQRPPEEWRAQAQVFDDSPNLAEDITFDGSWGRVAQLIDDVDVLGRVSGFIGAAGKPPAPLGQFLFADLESYTPTAWPPTPPLPGQSAPGNLTSSQTRYWYQVYGCDLGSSFPGKAPDGVTDATIFLFGDTLPFYANDVMGWSTSSAQDASNGWFQLHLFTGPKPFIPKGTPGYPVPQEANGAGVRAGDPEYDTPYTLLVIPPSDYPVCAPYLPLTTPEGFCSSGGTCTPFVLAPTDMRAYNIPYSGIYIKETNTTYVVLKLGRQTNNEAKKIKLTAEQIGEFLSYSLLTVFTPSTATTNATFRAPQNRARTADEAQLPISCSSPATPGGGRFVQPRFHQYTTPSAGAFDPTHFPPGAGPDEAWVLMWGKGFHNKPLKHKCLPGTNQATIYFAMTRLADFENIGNPQSATTYYYTSPFPFTPYPWSVDEAGANPLRAATGHSPLPGNFVDFSVGWIELDGVASDLSSGPSFGAARGLWVLLGHLTGSGGVLAYFSEKPWGPWTDPQVIFTDEQGYYPDDSYPYPTQGFIHDEGSNDGGNAICGPYPGPLRTEAEIHGAAYSPNFIEAYSILTPLYLPDGQVDGTFLRIMYTVSTWVPYYTVLMTADFFLSPSLVQWPKPAPVVKPGHPLPRVGKGGSIAL